MKFTAAATATAVATTTISFSAVSVTSASAQDRRVLGSKSKSSKGGYFENLPSLEEKYSKFVGKYAVCKKMYTAAEGDVNDLTLSSKQLGSSPLEGGRASYIDIGYVNEDGETPFSFKAERRWRTGTGLHDICYVGTASGANGGELIQFYSYLDTEEDQEAFWDEMDLMTCSKTGYADITMVCDIETNKEVDEPKVLTGTWYLTGPVNPEDGDDPCAIILEGYGYD